MDGNAFDRPAPEARRDMLAEEVDLLSRYERLARRGLMGMAALSATCVALVGLAGWALSKEKVYVYLAERDPAGVVRYVDLDAERNPDNAMIMSEIEHWLQRARAVTPSIGFNEEMRARAVAATTASSEDKDRLFDDARKELAGFGEHTVRAIEDLEFYPLTDDGRTWRLLWTEAVTDLRDMATDRAPMRAQVTVVVGDPDPEETLSGIRIVPPSIEERRR